MDIALTAIAGLASLDAARSNLYVDLVLASLSTAARRSLETMDPSKYEYQSDFARRYFSEGKQAGEAQGRAIGEVQGRAIGEAQGRAIGEVQGRAIGEVQGRAAVILRQLTQKFGALSDGQRQRLSAATVEELDAFAVRILTATSVEQVLV